MSLPMSEEAFAEMMDERTALPYGGYGNAMAQEAAWYHSQGLPCPFDCAACDPSYDDYDDAPLVRCGHCQGYHTIDGVRECSVATNYADEREDD